MKIIIIGKSGQLAWELNQLSLSTHKIICLGRNDIKLSLTSNVARTLKEHKSEAVINASGFTAVDDAESDIENAYAINTKAVGILAEACKELSLQFIHISTDFVFSGDKKAPYLPGDNIDPLSVYGNSKAEGERLISKYYPEKSAIIRTSWAYSVHGHNFVKTMLKLMRSKTELYIISDQIGSPTYARGLAKACISSIENNLIGIHHYTDTGTASWFDFAVAIQDFGFELGLLDKKISIKPILTSQYQTAAKRPQYSVLDKSSLVKALPELTLFHWKTQLQVMMKQLKVKNF